MYSSMAQLLSSVRCIHSIQISINIKNKQSKFGMDKLDGTSDNIYEFEADTSFSTANNKRPVDTNEEDVRPTIE